MKEQFVTYEIALKLKELGFDEECLAIYTHNNDFYKKGTFFLNHPHPFTIEELTPIVQDVRESTVYILAPLWQQVIDWFREKYLIDIDNGWCISNPFGKKQEGYNISVYDRTRDEFAVRDFHIDYYKAREQAILKAIESWKNN